MIGDKILFFRTSKRLTQDYMAHKLGISQKSYSNIETNAKTPTEHELDIIAAELGISKEALKNPAPVIIINDASHNGNGAIGVIEHQQNNTDKELLNAVLTQVAKKDEQIDNLLRQVERLLTLVEERGK